MSTDLERTEKLPLGSIRNVLAEPIKGHEEYYIMVIKSYINCSFIFQCINNIVLLFFHI